MPVILGIDAAWTPRQPSGVALVRTDGDEWRCLAVAPSYDAYLALARGQAVNWTQRSFPGTTPSAKVLLEASEQLAGERVDVVAIDMPIATRRFSSRRRADDAVSKEFGGRSCGTHTPGKERPGSLGHAASSSFVQAGYPIATASTTPGSTPCLMEVYPHVALLSLLARDHRVPYKVAKSGSYCPGVDINGRIAHLLTEFRAIHAALAKAFGDVGSGLQHASGATTLAGLKRHEDALDALVCAWVGAEYLAGRTTPLGDDTAAIWCPSNVISELPPG